MLQHTPFTPSPRQRLLGVSVGPGTFLSHLIPPSPIDAMYDGHGDPCVVLGGLGGDSDGPEWSYQTQWFPAHQRAM
jgi:hypothetical protein